MDAFTLQNVANVVIFIAPGYLFLQTYAVIYAKREREITRLLIESAVISLPIISVTNYLWENELHQKLAGTLSAKYVLFLVATSLVCGLIACFLRVRWPVRQLATIFGIGMPDEDFIRSQFSRLKDKKSPVTVTLKSGAVFSGTPNRGSIYSKGSPERYYFDNLAWDKQGEWDVRTGGLIVNLDEVEYIETPPLKLDTETYWRNFKIKVQIAFRNWRNS